MAKTPTSVAEVLRAFGKAKKETHRTIVAGMTKAGLIIYAKSQTLCPKDTGALRASGRVEVTGSGLGTRVKIAYGGTSAPYALYVHENPDAHHDAPTTYRWIPKAITATRGTVANVMKRAVRGELEKYVDGERVK